MLGYSDSTFLEDQTGMGYGLGVWAEWDLRIQPQPITFPTEPPWYLRKDGTAPPTSITIGKTEDAPEANGIETALDAGETINAWSPTMQFGFWLFAIVVVGFVGRRLVDHYLTNKK